MVRFSLYAEIRESVKTSMEERPLYPMAGPPTTDKMELIVEQLAKSMAGVRITAKEWELGKYGCPPPVLDDKDLKIATNDALTLNARLLLPDAIHPDIKDDTTQKEILRLTQVQDGVWSDYHTQEAATEVGVSMLVDAAELQYLVELDKM